MQTDLKASGLGGLKFGGDNNPAYNPSIRDNNVK